MDSHEDDLNSHEAFRTDRRSTRHAGPASRCRRVAAERASRRLLYDVGIGSVCKSVAPAKEEEGEDEEGDEEDEEAEAEAASRQEGATTVGNP